MLEFDRVEARGLVKMFGATRALLGIDLSLEAGVVTVIEGPNGAGKSTLISLLAQLAKPTRGTIRYGAIEGARASSDLRRRIGILGHASMLYPDLTGRENLLLFAQLFGVPNPEQRMKALSDRFEIGAFGDRPTRTCSRGQLQRLALARALVHSPRLLLLDEPSAGLDLQGIERLRSAVDEERMNGTIQVLVTHDMAIAEQLGTRRVRLERGRIAEAT